MMSFTFVVAVLMVGTVNGVVLLEWFNGSGPSATRRTRIVVPGSRKTYRLPWPMDLAGALKFVNILGIVITGTLILTIELGIWLFEPSLWRLLPPVTAFVALRVCIPSILKTLAARKREEALRDAELAELAELGEEEEDSGQ